MYDEDDNSMVAILRRCAWGYMEKAWAAGLTGEDSTLPGDKAAAFERAAAYATKAATKMREAGDLPEGATGDRREADYCTFLADGWRAAAESARLRGAALSYQRAATEARAAGDYVAATLAEYDANEAAASAVRMSSATGGAA